METQTYGTQQNIVTTPSTTQLLPTSTTSLTPYVREVVEIILGMGLITVGSFFLPQSWMPVNLVFCAFLLVVISMAVRYQTATAYTSGVLAALLYSLLLWQHPTWHPGIDLLHTLINPLLLLIIAVLISDVQRSQHRRLAVAEQQATEANDILQKALHNYQATLEINIELKQQITGQKVSMSTLTDRMTLFWQGEQEQRYTAILDAMVHGLEATSAALYIHKQGSLYFHKALPAGSQTYPSSLPTDDPLIRRVLEQRQVVTVRDLLAAGITPSGPAFMAGPLLNQKQELIGIIVIHSLPMLKCTDATIHLFNSLLHMASLALHGTERKPDEQGARPQFKSFPGISHPITPIRSVRINALEETDRYLLAENTPDAFVGQTMFLQTMLPCSSGR